MLNEQCFTGPDPLSVDYQPMTVLHFGGVPGNRLKIIGGIQSGDGLKGMHVVYDDAHAEQPTMRMGCTAHFPSPPDDIFEIDGAGGERITSVSVGTMEAAVPQDRLDFYKGGRVCYLMISRALPWIPSSDGLTIELDYDQPRTKHGIRWSF